VNTLKPALNNREFNVRGPEAGLDRLSSGQRDCLSLVAQMMTSKEIGRRLGISPHTVDERLKRAVATLGTATRFEAARMYVASLEHKDRPAFAWDDHQSMTYQAPEVVETAASFMLEPSSESQVRLDDGDQHELHEAHTPYFDVPRQSPSQSSVWSAFLDGHWENRLSPGARIASIILIAVLAVFAMGALVSIYEGLSRLT
jgi:DNA-binding CsgD family transcriptional regulator